MPWVRVADESAFFPQIMGTRSDPLGDERIVNEIFGFVMRLAVMSGGLLTDYVVDAGTVESIGGPRAQQLTAICVRAGLLEPTTTPSGGQAVKIIQDERLLHLRLRDEIAWERQQANDTRDPRLAVPIRRRDGDLCRYCGVTVHWAGRRSGRTATFDHRIPGQAMTVDTGVVACLSCNSARRDRPGWDAEHPLLPVPASPYYTKSTRNYLERNGVSLDSQYKDSSPSVPAGGQPLTPPGGVAQADTASVSPANRARSQRVRDPLPPAVSDGEKNPRRLTPPGGVAQADTASVSPANRARSQRVRDPLPPAVSDGEKNPRRLTPPGGVAQADTASVSPASDGARHAPPGVPAPERRRADGAAQVTESSFVGSGKGRAGTGRGRARPGGRSKRRRT